MSGPLEDQRITPERVERLMQAARIERARAIRAGLSGIFRRLRGLLRAKPERGGEPCPAPS
jgi:hypothetical protein